LEETLAKQNVQKIGIPCEEQQVLDADVLRTRADIEIFRTKEWRQVLCDVLQNFCLSHDVPYKQGMNEVNIRKKLLDYGFCFLIPY
jgi:hypothetical protein